MTNTTAYPARLGATTTEWAFAIHHFHVDLLPSICDMRGVKSVSDRLAHLDNLSKTPSVINREGHAHGFKAWVYKEATREELAEWSLDPALGILLNTRNVRAIDIDIENADVVKNVVSYIRASLGVEPWIRWRDNSPKCTILLRFEQNTYISKRVIQTPFGAIEFLANGQQTALFGTHKSGARFQLHPAAPDTGLPNGSVPVVSLEKVAKIWDNLRSLFPTDIKSKPLLGGEEGGTGPINRASGSPLPDDPVVDFLFEAGAVLAETDGIYHITCPWENEHTSANGVGGTSWLGRGVGGFEGGAFKCLHSHCSHRTTGEFLAKIKYGTRVDRSVFQALPAEMAIDSLPAPLPVLQEQPVSAPAHAWMAALYDSTGGAVVYEAGMGYLETNKQGIPSSNLGNALALLRHDKMQMLQCRRNVFSNTVEVKFMWSPDWERLADRHVSALRDAMHHRWRMTSLSTENARACFEALAYGNEYNSARERLLSLRWDGVKRVERFAEDILKAGDSAYGRAVSKYMWAAMAARSLAPGTKADMSPIFISRKQGTGKSTCVKVMALDPREAGEMSLSDLNDDVARRLPGKSVVELAELKGLATKDDESIKAWLSRTTEEWIPKYKEQPTTFARVNIFIGTSNKERMLRDPTGNRRWLPIYVAVTDRFLDWPSLEADNGFLREQLWAEATAMVLAHETADIAVDFYAAPANALAEGPRLAATIEDPFAAVIRPFLAGLSGKGVQTTASIFTNVINDGRPGLLGLDGIRVLRIENAMTSLGYELNAQGHWVLPEVF